MTDRDADQNANQPFVGAADRPQVGLHPDTPISELKVRDLQQLLGGGATLKPFVHDKPFIVYTKNYKFEKWENHKIEKFEHLKWEIIEVPNTIPNVGPGPVEAHPLVSHLSALRAHVQQLGQQIEELKQKG